MLTVTKKFEFEAAHRLPDYSGGNCKRLHGHSYKLQVEVSGPTAGFSQEALYPTMVVDFGDLKKDVICEVLAILDHSYLNDILPIPTAEALVEWIFRALERIFKENLQRIRLYETSDSYAEWRKD